MSSADYEKVKPVEIVKKATIDERPFVEKLWSRWETALLWGMGATTTAGGVFYALSFGGSPIIIYPELHEASVWAARGLLGLSTLYVASRGVRWLVSAGIESIRNQHLSEGIWHHIKK